MCENCNFLRLLFPSGFLVHSAKCTLLDGFVYIVVKSNLCISLYSPTVEHMRLKMLNLCKQRKLDFQLQMQHWMFNIRRKKTGFAVLNMPFKIYCILYMRCSTGVYYAALHRLNVNFLPKNISFFGYQLLLMCNAAINKSTQAVF